MRTKLLLLPLMAAGLLGGCQRPWNSHGNAPHHGRFAGIGVFDAGPLWAKMAVPKQAVSARAAAIADDQHVIVVVDSDTGEVRECGDMTGYCVAMNPWTRALAPEQKAPVALSAHAADLAAADETQKPSARHR